MKRVCVFAGSSPGARPEYSAVARALGEEIAARGLSLVYGGSNVGLMKVLADATLAAGGHVTGVIPESLAAREIAHPDLSVLEVVPTMQDRKRVMAELSGAFVALPGGMGTLDELLEVLTWSQLGEHTKPCGLLNVNGYYDELLRFLDHTTQERFVRQAHRDMVLVEDSPAALLDAFEHYVAPTVEKWIP